MSGAVLLGGVDTRGASPAALAATRRPGVAIARRSDLHGQRRERNGLWTGQLCLPADEIERRIGSWLDRLGLASLRHQATQTLSGGQKQRLLLASILAMSPRLLLFDAACRELDATGAAELLDLLDSTPPRRILDHRGRASPRRTAPAGRSSSVLDQGRLSADCTRSDPTLPHALDTAGLIVEGADVPFCAGPSNSEDGPCGTTIVRAGSLEMELSTSGRAPLARARFSDSVGPARGCDRSRRIGAKALFCTRAGRLHATLGRANQNRIRWRPHGSGRLGAGAPRT